MKTFDLSYFTSELERYYRILDLSTQSEDLNDILLQFGRLFFLMDEFLVDIERQNLLLSTDWSDYFQDDSHEQENIPLLLKEGYKEYLTLRIS